MVPAAVDLPVLEEVDQIDQQLAAGDTLEALRVPAAAVTSPTGEHGDVSAADLSAALEIYGGSGRCRGKEVRWHNFDQIMNAAGRAAVCQHSPVIIKPSVRWPQSDACVCLCLNLLQSYKNKLLCMALMCFNRFSGGL